MGCQRNKKICVSQRQNLQINGQLIKNRKTQKYRNKITDLLKTSKQAHYHKYFEENKKNYRTLWIGINQILNSKIKN